MRVIPWLLVAAAALGCEKDGMPAARGSGALASAEVELFTHLPGGGNVVFGGNYFGLQDWMASSPLGRMSRQMDPVSAKWNACLGRADFTMAGAGGFRDGVLRMSMFMKGVQLAKVEQCSRDAGLPITVDPDGKFMSIELTSNGVTLAMPYLQVDGGVYTVVAFHLEPGKVVPEAMPTSRADLEREQAALPHDNLAADARVTGWLARVDRRRTFYFAGSGDGTPLAAQLGLIYGGMDVKDGLTFDVTAEVRADGGPDRVVSAWNQARSQLGSLPASMSSLKDAIRSIRLGKVGGSIRVVARFSDAQLEALVGQLAPFMPTQP